MCRVSNQLIDQVGALAETLTYLLISRRYLNGRPKLFCPQLTDEQAKSLQDTRPAAARLNFSCLLAADPSPNSQLCSGTAAAQTDQKHYAKVVENASYPTIR
jgi:hypothetical protein